MLNTLRFCLCNVSRSSCVNYSIQREARMLQKFIDRGLKKKKGLPKSSGKLSEEFIPVNEHGDVPSRRVSMLNNVYVKTLMEIMSTGHNSISLHKLGIQITRLRLSNDLKTLSIYWISTNSTDFTDENLKAILDQTASELQYQITSYRVTGKTPNVRFVRDLANQGYLEVQNLLLALKEEEMAEPSTDSLTDDEDETPENLQEYTKDVLGLDHAKIMARIQAAKSRTKTFDLSPPKQSDRGRVEKLIPFDRKTFEKFYLRKRILEKKLQKFEYRTDHGKSFEDYYEIGDDFYERYSSNDETSEGFEEDQLDWSEDNPVDEGSKKR